MNYKKYAQITIGVLLFLLVYNGIVWHFYTKQWFEASTTHIGDLSRLGYLPEAAHPRKTYTNLPLLHRDTNQISLNSNIEIAIIGDSFVAGVSGGKNPSFTDYICSDYNKSVVNIGEFPGTNEFIETIALLANSGFFDRLHTKIVIIESTERQLARRFARDTNFNKNESLENIAKTYSMLGNINTDSPLQNSLKTSNNADEGGGIIQNRVGFINNGNFKFILNKIIYLFSNTSPLTNVVIKDLNQSLFSTKADKKLLNFKRDIYMKDVQDTNNMVKINDNLNTLADLLAKKGVRLIFMPAVAKYTIYEPYIINNTFPKDRFFENFAKLPKRYCFLNTKDILSNAMPTKDMFYGDDTHWSYIASDIIISSQEFKQIINPKGSR